MQGAVPKIAVRVHDAMRVARDRLVAAGFSWVTAATASEALHFLRSLMPPPGSEAGAASS